MRLRYVAAAGLLFLILFASTGSAISMAAGQPMIPHTLHGLENCTYCHKVNGEGVGQLGGTGMTSIHEGRDNKTCAMCHRLSVSKKRVPVSPQIAVPAASHVEAPGTGSLSIETNPLSDALFVLSATFLILGLLLLKLEGWRTKQHR